ncbi:hypothetical protein, partial [Metapseudomonas otitidis]|uniref:hypothetical protein n=1 Tax=Metapseudomonas otitidis TaxID=319939 RepID=UPI00281215AC
MHLPRPCRGGPVPSAPLVDPPPATSAGGLFHRPEQSGPRPVMSKKSRSRTWFLVHSWLALPIWFFVFLV